MSNTFLKSRCCRCGVGTCEDCYRVDCGSLVNPPVFCFVGGDPGDRLITATARYRLWRWDEPCDQCEPGVAFPACQLVNTRQQSPYAVEYLEYGIRLTGVPLDARQLSQCNPFRVFWAPLGRPTWALDSFEYDRGCTGPPDRQEGTDTSTDEARFFLQSEGGALHWVLNPIWPSGDVVSGYADRSNQGTAWDAHDELNALIYELADHGQEGAVYQVDTGCITPVRSGRNQCWRERIIFDCSVVIELAERRCDANCERCV